MTHIRDRDEIRCILNADRVWAIYALADLDPALFAQCEWWTSGTGLMLVFTGIPIHPIFVSGPKEDVHVLLRGLPFDQGYLNLRDEHTPQSIYQYDEPHRMRRMVLHELQGRIGATVQLGPANATEILQLFATGSGAGVAFGAFQLETGYFRGLRERGELVAVAGVHVVSVAESVAGVGNIFTRADHRGRGLAQITTSAVVTALLETGITTIGLNVEHDNLPAISAYEKLGFQTAFEYWEGRATRR